MTTAMVAVIRYTLMAAGGLPLIRAKINIHLLFIRQLGPDAGLDVPGQDIPERIGQD